MHILFRVIAVCLVSRFNIGGPGLLWRIVSETDTIWASRGVSRVSIQHRKFHVVYPDSPVLGGDRSFLQSIPSCTVVPLYYTEYLASRSTFSRPLSQLNRYSPVSEMNMVGYKLQTNGVETRFCRYSPKQFYFFSK